MTSVAILNAFARDGRRVARVQLSLDQYYDSEWPVLDDAATRTESSVVVVTGDLYNADGKLYQTFPNVYDTLGKLRHTRAIHDDGTVLEDSYDP